jgi:hypothetical protein
MNSIFCNIILCTTVKVNQHLFVAHFMLVSYLAYSVNLKMEVITFLQNVSLLSPDYATLQPRRQNPSQP